ncbi:unnamed protein product [Adineta steineri]|uniref:Uncharacterized protein n=1 Tax=Adineta steineri TaxID=433720 RepID=A0A820AHV2_9BILA|nr:unnamed protein product [Adineta steineri]
MHLPNILKSKGRRTTKAAALIATQLNILYHGCIVIIVMSVLSSLSIAALVIGFIKQGECPIQAWIPRWLIIFGSVGLGWCALFILMAIVKMSCCHREEHCRAENCFMTGFCFLLIVFVFFFSWMIAGSVWVFTVRTRVQFEYPSDANYCQKLVYNMAFGCILTQYGIIGLALCLTACCFALVKICDRD